MSFVTFQEGFVILRDGEVGFNDACCCDKCQNDEECCYCVYQFFIPEPLDPGDFAAARAVCENDCEGIFEDLGGGLGSCTRYFLNPECDPNFCDEPRGCFAFGFPASGFCCSTGCSPFACNPLP